MNAPQLPTRDLPTLAADANASHRKAQDAARSALEHARDAGEALNTAKRQVKHGEWMPWLEANFEASDWTARAYMRIARQWPEVESQIGDASPISIRGALGLLAEPKDEDAAGSPPLTLADAPDPRAFVSVAILAEIQRIAPGVRFSPVGMELPEGLSFEDWKRVGQLLFALPGVGAAMAEVEARR